MPRPFNSPDEREKAREKIIGLGERSIRKSYYPELQQRLSELERFKALLDQSQDAVLLARTPSGRLVDANASACRQSDYSREEMLGLILGDLIPAGAAERINRRIPGNAAVEDNLTLTTMLRKRSGADIPVEMTVRSVIFDGEFYHVIVARDITERVLAEAARREADQRKDQFLAMLAHELRNPLSPIVTAVDLIRRHPAAQIPEMRRWVGTINRQVHHLTRIVDDLLDTSRISRGLIVLKKERITLSDAVTQAVEINRALFTAHQQELKINLPAEMLFLHADPVRLVQILSNLLNNASKFSPAGGRISLTGRAEGAQAVIEVNDNGQGISADILPRIFDLFYQADTSLDRAKGGLGLGLMLVKQLVQLHGGVVEARSQGPNQGSTFILRLPLAETPEPARGEPFASYKTETGLPGLKVLLVEDNPDSAESLRELLAYWGHQAWVAHDGPGGIKQALQTPPDVVLLDIGLPGMDGYQTAERMRREAALSETALFALTGYAFDRPRIEAAGFQAYFTKPVDLNALEDRLAAVAKVKPPRE